ncbi:MAG: YlxR family protein [Cyanobacteriota bacterium]|nr:YlxR family protein [Cyanobacteriota bacterium]
MPSRGRPVLRRCVACRQLKDRVDLWRVVRLAGGGLALDAGMGRSAYLCPEPACLEDARRRRRLQRSLRCAVEETIFTTLEGRLPPQRAPTEAR